MSAATTIVCADCGEPISEARLNAVPSATRCLDCQMFDEQEPTRRIDHRCPRCNGRLVWRCRQRGSAEYFIGCSEYPHCRHTE